jgi:hypothetical protein
MELQLGSLPPIRRGAAAALAVLSIFLLSGAARAQEPAATKSGMTWEEVNRRFGQALERNRALPVVYQDILGEGPERWDPDPRYPSGQVNCITWLYLLLTETYSDQPAERQHIMDRIRYYDGQIGFGFRKHFTDQWMALDPKPLTRVDLSRCAEVKDHHVVLDPKLFASNISYSCPLYHQDKTAFDIPNVNSRGLIKCAGTLRPGYYIVFPLASKKYLDRYGTKSGPMAQVHAVVLQVPAGSQKSAAADFKIYHASIGKGYVVETTLDSYLWDMSELFRGYAVYELDPAWDWTSSPPLNDEAKALQSCESKLQGRVGDIFEASAAPKPHQ